MKYNNLLNNLEKLKLDKMRDYLPKYIDEINRNDISFVDALYELTEKEIEFKADRASLFNIKVAHFPFNRTLDEFDFDFQPSINKKEILDLATLRFIEEKKNILFMGSPGVGKTHLATALGIEAAKKRNSVYFISCNDLITNLSNAFKENRLESKIKFYCKYKLLIIDEIGYLPITKDEANMFFQLIAKRYENKSTIITTNQQFSKWGEVFGDTIIASAIIDRLVHHSIIINIKGKSYRIKDLVQNDFEQQKNNL